MKRLLSVFYLLIIGFGITNASAQNSYQKLLLSDSTGCFGMVINPDSSLLLGIQWGNKWKLLSVDQEGAIQNEWISTDTRSIYLQQMLHLNDGGTVITGNIDDAAMIFKLNSQFELDWALRKAEAFGFTVGYYEKAVQDISGNIAVIGFNSAYYSLICINPQGQWRWTLEPSEFVGFTCLRESKDGGFYLGGRGDMQNNLWKISSDGTTLKSLSITMLNSLYFIRDVLELPDNQLLMLIQYKIDNNWQFALIKLDANWNQIFCYNYTYYQGFRDVGTLLMDASDRFIVVGNANNPGIITQQYPPYQVCRAEFTLDGECLTSFRYSGGRVISGVSQSAIHPDHSTIISGYACDSMSYPYFPYVLKTNAVGLTSCFMDTINLSRYPSSINVQTIDSPLNIIADSIVPIDMTFTQTNPQTFNTLCFTGIQENNNLESLFVIPNPASNNIEIVIRDLRLRNPIIEIYNVSGQVVKRMKYSEISESLKIDISQLNAGCYFLKILAENKVLTTKFLKN